MTSLEAMGIVGRHFNELGLPYVFLGASVLPLLVENPGILDIRPTVDIDLTVQIVTLPDHYRLEEALRHRGFRNDDREGAPICRWIIEETTVDVMPTQPTVLGMTCEWFHEAVQDAQHVRLGESLEVPVVRWPYFLATKLTAFRDRGASDPFLSKDLDDIVTLLNGTTDIESPLSKASEILRKFLAQEIAAHLRNPDFSDAVAGFFRTDIIAQERANMVLARMKRLAEG